MRTTKFGIEIEMTGITRSKAAEVLLTLLGGRSKYTGGVYSTYEITAPDSRKWKLMSDASIKCEKKGNGRKIEADKDYSVELVSPILTYNRDIETIQEIIRRLRKAGAHTNSSCGIHIHLNGSNHNARSIRNFINIIASKNDLFYKALDIAPERVFYCKELDKQLVDKMNKKKPKTLDNLSNIWYHINEDNRGLSQTSHYHSSRYHFLNLHSFFTRNHTVELRGYAQ